MRVPTVSLSTQRKSYAWTSDLKHFRVSLTAITCENLSHDATGSSARWCSAVAGTVTRFMSIGVGVTLTFRVPIIIEAALDRMRLHAQDQYRNGLNGLGKLAASFSVDYDAWGSSLIAQQLSLLRRHTHD